jgi:hypothetical protein
LDYARDILADVAHFCVLGCFHSEERCIGQVCKASGKLSLTTACWALHQNILWGYLLLQVVWQAFSPPTISKRDRDCSLRICLPNNKPIKVLNYLLRGKLVLFDIGFWKQEFLLITSGQFLHIIEKIFPAKSKQQSSRTQWSSQPKHQIIFKQATNM